MKNENLTVGQIARVLGVPQANVAYHITKNQIKEQGRVGIIRVFNPLVVKQLRNLMDIDNGNAA